MVMLSMVSSMTEILCG